MYSACDECVKSLNACNDESDDSASYDKTIDIDINIDYEPSDDTDDDFKQNSNSHNEMIKSNN